MKEKIEKLISEYSDKVSQLQIKIISTEFPEDCNIMEAEKYAYSTVIDDLRQVVKNINYDALL